jgi:hypothetical protein
MRGHGATYNTLYADDSDDDSDGFGCVFPKDGAGFDTDSDGSDFSNLADDLYEKASVDSFEFDPPSKQEREGGSGYNRAKLDMDDDAVSVGSDKEFQRASKSNKKWNWVEADEESVGSDSDFEVQFEGRGNSVYDLKAGQGEVEDFLGGGGGEDLNEDFEFRTDFGDAQRTEAFFNEGQPESGGGAPKRGGVNVPTERGMPRAGRYVAGKRGVDPRFIAAHGIEVGEDEPAGLPKSSGKSKSAALIAAGLAQAQAKKGKTRYGGKVETRVGDATEAEVIPITHRGPGGRVEGAAPIEKLDELLEAEDTYDRLESDAAAKERIERSLRGIKADMKAAVSTDEMEAIEERVLAELDNIGDDIRKGIKALERRGTETNKSRVAALKSSLAALEARIEEGLTMAAMLKISGLMMKLDHEYNKLSKEVAVEKKTAVKREVKVRARERGEEGDDEGEAPRGIPAGRGRPPPVPAQREEGGAVPATGIVGEVELKLLGKKKMAIKFADSEVRINEKLGLDKLESLLAGVRAEAGAKVNDEVKKEIISRLRRAISAKKLALDLRSKRAPSGFVKARAEAAVAAPPAPEPPRPRGVKNTSGLTQAQRSQRAK